jgi:hypothetical protein
MITKLSNFRLLLNPKVILSISQSFILFCLFQWGHNAIKRMNSGGLPEKLRRNYERFQMKDGTPVYLKGGVGDRILFGLTLIVVAVGVVESYYSIICLDKKKK